MTSDGRQCEPAPCGAACDIQLYGSISVVRNSYHLTCDPTLSLEEILNDCSGGKSPSPRQAEVGTDLWVPLVSPCPTMATPSRVPRPTPRGYFRLPRRRPRSLWAARARAPAPNQPSGASWCSGGASGAPGCARCPLSGAARLPPLRSSLQAFTDTGEPSLSLLFCRPGSPKRQRYS